MDDPLLTTQEVADKLRTSEGTLRFWRHKGTGPRSARLGKRVVYRTSDVEAWLADRFEDAVGDDLAPAAGDR
jgi:excisionase family DNA binding protein